MALLLRNGDALRPGTRVSWVDDGERAEFPNLGEIGQRLISSFKFKQENSATGEIGLRPPQIGAVYSVLGHWSVSNEPVTVIMPTGTGKTETMLALFAHSGFERLLVLVPNVPLRGQTLGKFLSLGLLRELGILPEDVVNPVVGCLEHELSTAEEVDELFGSCNVVIGTMQAIAGSSDGALDHVAEVVTHLFIDEAHHVAAPGWSGIKARFRSCPIVQFTATPYRRDGKRVDGKPIFNYPLRKAQSEGYFKPIRYVPVFEFTKEKGDTAIVLKAIEQLGEDRGNGFDHLIMARCKSIVRAEEIISLYERAAPELNPVIVHSQMGVARRRNAIEAIRSRTSRVVVCVDMLGEGFDLPQLKIAALHDVHKSLAITLQFTGRFTRTAGGALGDATMVANAADVDVSNRLRELYSEDADWNRIIQKLGEEAVGRRLAQSEFLDSFTDLGGEIPIQNILPKMSTVVFRTNYEDWSPEAVIDAIDPDELYTAPSVSRENNCVLFVTCERDEVPWGDIRDLQNTTWHLYLLHWDPQTKLLYINSSNNGELHQRLADAVRPDGDDVEEGTAELISGEAVYRALFGIKRLILITLGLSHAAGRAIRFTGHFGSDIAEMLSPAQLASKTKTNLFGRGYEGGERASIGCSRKGRVWSHRQADDISAWVEWCHALGVKLMDETITADEILRGILRPEPVRERPALVPLAIDWSHRIYQRGEEGILIRIGTRTVPFYEIGLTLSSHEDAGPIRFKVHAEDRFIEYEIVFRDETLIFVSTGEFEASAVFGRGRTVPLSQLFMSEPPTILFEKDTFIEDNLLFRIARGGDSRFNRDSIEAWDWTDVDLSRESQRDAKHPDSIQRHVINRVLEDESWELVFDDDEAGESADVVAVRRSGDVLVVKFLHCKYAIDGTVGARVKDLYELCGQAQKSVRWRDDVVEFFDHLKLRESQRQANQRPSRIERGDPKLLIELFNQCRYMTPRFEIALVQPGLSKEGASLGQLELLGATQIYLQESLAIPLSVISSA